MVGMKIPPTTGLVAMQGASPLFEIVMLLAVLPALALSRKETRGWRSGLVFATSYPPLVVAFAALLALGLKLIAPLCLISFS